jgi:predicted 2-oxoglutarate/Fe(II)-dependent dioxygenase YbiX
VRQARALLDAAPWGDGRASAGDQAALVKHNEQLPHDCEAARTVRAIVLRGLDRQPLFLSAALPRKMFTPRFNRYSGDANHYGDHVDNAIRFADSGQRVRTDLSCTVFLSDPGVTTAASWSSTTPSARTQHASSCRPATLVLYPAPACTRWSRSRAARGWPASSGSRAWCAATSSAACCSTWTWPDAICASARRKR